ncbi:MAG TPA: hypothetical protein VF203_01220 [Burkholderiales bacterium]
MRSRLLPVLCLLGLGALSLPAHANGGAADPLGMERAEAERPRAAGEEACRDVLDAAAALGAQLHALSRDTSQRLLAMREQAAREAAPALRALADRLQETARDFEQSGGR